MPVIFGPSSGTALKTINDFYHRNHCMDSETLPEMILCEHSLPCHPKMLAKAVACKEEAI